MLAPVIIDLLYKLWHEDMDSNMQCTFSLIIDVQESRNMED